MNKKLQTNPNNTKVSKLWVVEIHVDVLQTITHLIFRSARSANGDVTITMVDGWIAEWEIKNSKRRRHVLQQPRLNAYRTLPAAVRRLARAARSCDEYARANEDLRHYYSASNEPLRWRIRNTKTGAIIPAEALGL